jgi:hypothetical protein
MGKQLSIVGTGPEPAVDRTRAALKAKEEPPKPARVVGVIGVLPLLAAHVIPAFRSRRIKQSAPRLLRQGDRPQSLGNELTPDEQRFAGVTWMMEQEGVRFGPPPKFGACPKKGPCTHVACRHHAGIEADGEFLKVNFPDRDIDQLPETCTLRVANKGERKKGNSAEIGNPVLSCEDVGAILNLTAERVRQEERGALKKFKRRILALMPELKDD